MARVLTVPTFRAAGAAVACLGLVVACAGTPDELDAAGIAAAVPAALAPEDPGSVTDVVCPETVERGIGIVVTCSAEVGGTPVTATVEQLDDDGRLAIETTTVLLDRGDIAAGLADRLQSDLGVLVGVDCDDPRVVVPAAGDEFGCTASDEAGRPIELVVRLLDAEGAYDVRPAD